jgi:ectoine hydroxylase-related dioxygenase (phytanoyl-CoA dioxygenase family)
MNKTKPVSVSPTWLHEDDEAKNLDLDDLGWVGLDPGAEEFVQKRACFEANNGIKGLEIVPPEDIERATRIFHRDGFVVVKDVLNSDQLELIQQGCDRVIHEIMALDKNRSGNRGSHRYSFGSSSRTGHQVHNQEWAMLIDLPTVTPILTSIFGSSDYIARGGGGDFCLPGAVDYQPIHSDMGARRIFKNEETGQEFSAGSFLDPTGKITYRDLPCPYIACNFLMVDFDAINGPIRQIPGTQNSLEPMPDLEQEPEWMKLSTLCPAEAGSVVIRDPRAWHGGTPNLSNKVRAIPNIEYYAPWFREPMPISMPRDIYNTLSKHGQEICRYIVAAEGVEIDTGLRRSLGGTPFSSKSRKPSV